MKDHQLRALIQVAERGSIRAAARDMSLSQSALTKALRELEKDVGAELLTRSYRGVAFTPSGNALLKRARMAITSLAKAREEIRFLSSGVGARVSVATTPLVAMHALPKIWNEFCRVQPDAELTLTEGLLTTVVPGLIEGQLDFAVAIADPADLPQEISFERLQDVDAMPAGRIGNPLTAATCWAELRTARWVLNLSPGSQGQTFLSWMQRQGVGLTHKVTQCASPVLMAELMRRTDALGFCPRILLDDLHYGVGLRALHISPLPPPMALGIITLKDAHIGGSARQLASLFRRYLKPQLSEYGIAH